MGHDQLNVLILKSISIDFLVIVFIVLLAVGTLDGLAGLAVAVVVAGVVVVTTRSGERLSRSLLGRRVQILDLGFTEDANVLVRNAEC